MRIGKVFGIPIYLHYSWFVIFVLVTLSLAEGYFPQFYPDWQRWLYWAVGIATSLLFFASVVAHELAHSLVSRSYGVPVKSITLFIFGGLARIGREVSQPGRELVMALAGPLSSLAIAGLFAVVYIAVRETNQPVAALAWWLLRINTVLALFNLVPGFPLDGGRVFRAILWWVTGNYRRATRIAVIAGRGIGYAFMGGGLGIVLLTGDWLGGVWFTFIGWFLESAASASYQQVVFREALKGITAAQVMTAECSLVGPGLTLQELVDGVFLPRGTRCALVTREGKLRGMLTMGNLRAIPQERWLLTPVEQAMVPLLLLHTARPEDEAVTLLERMEEEGIGQMAVVRDGEAIGMVFRDQLLRVARTRAELGSDRNKNP